MPDWLYDPLLCAHEIFEQNLDGSDFEEKIFEFFKSKYENDSSDKIPQLNSSYLNDLKNGQLVKFRCFVQDETGQEYYNRKYEVKDSDDNRKKCLGLFGDIQQCKEGETVLEEEPSEQNLGQRHVRYCISLPGQNDWVEQAQKGKSNCSEGSSKRSLETDDTQSDEVSKKARLSTDPPVAPAPQRPPPVSHTSRNHPRYNCPLPDPRALACLAYFYGEEVRVNAVLEVAGILILDESDETLLEEGKERDCSGALGLPSNVVPRLHVVAHRPLEHYHPSLQEDAPMTGAEAREAHEMLRVVLETACLGDGLAADYLIASLLGRVYAKEDGVAQIGQFPLNITGLHGDSGFPQRLYSLLQRLLSLSHCLPLTVSNLNTMAITPHKEPSCDHLSSGLLQLPPRFCLVVDETAMQPGQLTERGVRSLEEIRKAVLDQSVHYAFPFGTVVEMDLDVNVLVLSEGRSLIGAGAGNRCCELPLRPHNTSLPAAFSLVEDLLTPGVEATLRRYLATQPLMEYDLGPFSKNVQDEFVAARAVDKKSFTAEQFQQLLMLSRFQSIARGEAVLVEEVWEACKELERQRQERLQTPPSDLGQMNL